jgi:hypothetical protein
VNRLKLIFNCSTDWVVIFMTAALGIAIILKACGIEPDVLNMGRASLSIGFILGTLQAFTDNNLGVRDRVENEKDLE